MVVVAMRLVWFHRFHMSRPCTRPVDALQSGSFRWCTPLEFRQELQRGAVAESLMRADGVVGVLPGAQLPIEGGQVPVGGGDLMELLGMGAVGAFDVAVELRGAGREDEEPEAKLLAGLLEVGGELATAIDLHGADRKGHAGLEG